MDLTPTISRAAGAESEQALPVPEPFEEPITVPVQPTVVPTQLPTEKPQVVPIQKYYCPKTLRNRHMAIMEQMVAHPEWDQNTMAEKLGYTASRFSIIVNSPLFVFAFKEYRKSHIEKISDLVTEATTAAITFSKEVIENKDVDLVARQASARDILSQGHARATERKATMNFDVPVPVEALGGLEKILAEMAQPYKASRLLTVPPGGNGDEGT